MAEMKWGEIKSGGNGEATPYIKLVPGINVMRVVGLPYETEIHWEETIDGAKKRLVCSGVGCPICKAGHVPQKKFQVLVIDRTDNKLKILEGGNSIFRQIKDYAMDPEYGDPSKYDIKIKKEGTGRETKYTIVASPKKTELTAEESALLKDAKTLSDLNRPKTLDEIQQLNLVVLGGSNSATVDDEWGSENTETISSSDDDWDAL